MICQRGEPNENKEKQCHTPDCSVKRREDRKLMTHARIQRFHMPKDDEDVKLFTSGTRSLLTVIMQKKKKKHLEILISKTVTYRLLLER